MRENLERAWSKSLLLPGCTENWRKRESAGERERERERERMSKEEPVREAMKRKEHLHFTAVPEKKQWEILTTFKLTRILTPAV